MAGGVRSSDTGLKLAKNDVNPSRTWTYESFSHPLALRGGRRGGIVSLYAVSAAQILRLAASKLPWL